MKWVSVQLRWFAALLTHPSPTPMYRRIALLQFYISLRNRRPTPIIIKYHLIGSLQSMVISTISCVQRQRCVHVRKRIETSFHVCTSLRTLHVRFRNKCAAVYFGAYWLKPSMRTYLSHFAEWLKDRFR